MSLRFVLDENVLRFALVADHPGHIGLRCAKLLRLLREHCQHKLVWSPEILPKYYAQIKEVPRPTAIGTAARRELMGLIFGLEKFLQLEVARHSTANDDELLLSPGTWPPSVKPDDIPFAAAALSGDAVLVTEDAPLRTALAGHTSPVRVATVNEALAMIRRSSDHLSEARERPSGNPLTGRLRRSSLSRWTWSTCAARESACPRGPGLIA